MATRMMVAAVLMSTAAMAQQTVASRSSTGRKPFLLPAQILRRMQASSVEFRISGIETLQDVARGRLADETWKQLVQPIEYPKVKRKGSSISVEAWPRPTAIEEPMARAEEAFQQRHYAEAALWYRRTLAVAPDFYIAHAYLGDTHLFGTGGARKAIEEYDQAIAANPDDYRLYFFRANARRRLVELDAMLSDLRQSLVLKPRNALLLSALQKARGLMGHPEPEVLVPRGFVRREGEAIGIYADIERPEWLAWANCKALWMVDAAHRQEMLGSPEYGWSTVEELECLGSLMAIYQVRKASGEGGTDDRLERLSNIINDGLAPAFVIYELGSRVDPQIVLRLDPKFRVMMSSYVEKYVLTATE